MDVEDLVATVDVEDSAVTVDAEVVVAEIEAEEDEDEDEAAHEQVVLHNSKAIRLLLTDRLSYPSPVKNPFCIHLAPFFHRHANFHTIFA